MEPVFRCRAARCERELRRFLGEKGLIALERLMGMILVAVSIQMLLSGVQAALVQPRPPS